MFRQGLFRVAPFLLVLVALSVSGTGPIQRAAGEPRSDRYYIRVSECDDGGRAFINGTQVVDVGFNESSDWLEITPDLGRRRNLVRFQVMNRTGAITYHFQIRRNDELIYEKTCGTVAVRGCEENRAFRVGMAREFVFRIDQ